MLYKGLGQPKPIAGRLPPAEGCPASNYVMKWYILGILSLLNTMNMPLKFEGCKFFSRKKSINMLPVLQIGITFA